MPLGPPLPEGGRQGRVRAGGPSRRAHGGGAQLRPAPAPRPPAARPARGARAAWQPRHRTRAQVLPPARCRGRLRMPLPLAAAALRASSPPRLTCPPPLQRAPSRPAGFAEKQGTGSSLFGGKSWKKRFFTLDNGVLSYFEDESVVRQ